MSLFLSDDPGCDDPEEEVSSGQVPVRGADCDWRGPLPLQAQQSGRNHGRPRLWLRRDVAGKWLLCLRSHPTPAFCFFAKKKKEVHSNIPLTN